jgi:transcriptional regulator with XRE-family HTH domain
MDKRELATRFSKRLRQILESGEGGTAAFVRDTGIDRSALSQFLDPRTVRLPRAEALRNIAIARGISVDWLLDLETAQEGRQEVSSSIEIEGEKEEDVSPLERWREEADGHKMRYVPSTLPDMLSLAGLQPDDSRDAIDARGSGVENVLEGMDIHDMDLEIAMPIQTLEDVTYQSGLWRHFDPELCKRQLTHIAAICNETYPTLRLHLYDGTKTFSAAFTVFGKMRVAIYIGEAYLVVTSKEQIKTFVQRFDGLVRQSIIRPNKVDEHLASLASKIKP